MIQESLNPRNITVLKVTMLMMELKIHEAKKNARTAGEIDESTLTVRDAKIPAQQWTEERHSHLCSGRVCGTPPAGQDSCSAVDRRASKPSLLWSSLWNTPPRSRSVFSDGQKSVAVILALREQPTQAHRAEIDHILVHKQVRNKLKYLKYYKICSPTITELNSKSIEEHYL